MFTGLVEDLGEVLDLTPMEMANACASAPRWWHPMPATGTRLPSTACV